MKQCMIITSDSVFEDAVKHYARFLQLKFTMTAQSEANGAVHLNPHDVILCGPYDIWQRLTEPVRLLRERGRFTRAILFGRINPATAQHFADECEYVTCCPEPFKSESFVATLQRVAWAATQDEREMALRQTIHDQLEQRLWPDAILSVKQLRQISSNVPRCRQLIAAALVGQGRLKEAQDQLKRALQESPNFLPARFTYAKLLAKAGKKQLSEKFLQEILATYPDHLDATLMLAESRGANGKLDESFKLFQKALTIHPTSVAAHQGLLAVAIIRDDTTNGRQHLDWVPPGTAFPFIAKWALILAEHGQFAQAAKFVSQATQITGEQQNEHKIWMNLGLTAKKQGKVRQAIALFDKCKQTAPANYDRVDQQLTALQGASNKKLKQGA